MPTRDVSGPGMTWQTEPSRTNPSPQVARLEAPLDLFGEYVALG